MSTVLCVVIGQPEKSYIHRTMCGNWTARKVMFTALCVVIGQPEKKSYIHRTMCRSWTARKSYIHCTLCGNWAVRKSYDYCTLYGNWTLRRLYPLFFVAACSSLTSSWAGHALRGQNTAHKMADIGTLKTICNFTMKLHLSETTINRALIKANEGKVLLGVIIYLLRGCLP